MSEPSLIQTEVLEGGLGILRLNRPDKRNALSIRVRREISACLDEWKTLDAVRLVILTGNGPTFSAGFDLKEFGEPACYQELFDSSARYHRDVWYFPKPTLAAINGPAFGGGFDLATLCDLRICSEVAAFGHPEIKLGAPPLFSPLRWIVGNGMARDLCLTGRRIDAKEARRIGLVSEVVPATELVDRAIAMGKSILEAPDLALAATKRYIARASNDEFETAFRIEHDEVFKDHLLNRNTS